MHFLRMCRASLSPHIGIHLPAHTEQFTSYICRTAAPSGRLADRRTELEAGFQLTSQGDSACLPAAAQELLSYACAPPNHTDRFAMGSHYSPLLSDIPKDSLQ